MIQMYGHYKSGYLPADGGLLDQTPQYLRAMGIIDDLVHKHQVEQNKKNR